MSEPSSNAAAFVHAEDLTHAVAELLRFAREGASTNRFPFQLEEIATYIADALAFILRTEIEALFDDEPDAARRAANQQLFIAVANWLQNTDEGEVQP